MTDALLLNLYSQSAPALIMDAIGLGEDAQLESESSFQKEVVKTLAAFANNSVGSVLISVSDKKQIMGLTLQPETAQGWVNQCKQNTSLSVIPDIDLIEVHTLKNHAGDCP